MIIGPSRLSITLSSLMMTAILVVTGLCAGDEPKPKAEGKKDDKPADGKLDEAKIAKAKAAARKGLDYYASIMQKGKWGKGGGWCGSYSEDLSHRGGEANQPVPEDVILIQPVGTANVATVYLHACKVLGDDKYLEVARQAAEAVIGGQTKDGGWNYEMWLPADGPKGIHVYPGASDWSKKQPNPTDNGTLDDETTFAASEFMYVMWMVTKEERFHQSWLKSMEFLLTCQLLHGGYRQAYPVGGYHAYATFNDGAMLNAVNFLLKAYQRTGDEKYLKSVKKCGDFLISCQSKGGGYGTQHKDTGEVAGARKFEPPALGPDATRDAIAILATLYDWTGDPKYLAPLGKASSWLQKVQISAGRWARFYHPDSDKPWYRNLEGQDVATAKEAKPGYTWQGAWGASGIAKAKAYAGKAAAQPRTVTSGGNKEAGFTLRGAGFSGLHGSARYSESVDEIIANQDDKGRWFTARGKGKGGNMATRQWTGYMERLLAAITGEKPPSPDDD